MEITYQHEQLTMTIRNNKIVIAKLIFKGFIFSFLANAIAVLPISIFFTVHLYHFFFYVFGFTYFVGIIINAPCGAITYAILKYYNYLNIKWCLTIGVGWGIALFVLNQKFVIEGFFILSTFGLLSGLSFLLVDVLWEKHKQPIKEKITAINTYLKKSFPNQRK